MSRTDLVSYLLGDKCPHLTKAEKLLLEVKLFTLVCNELCEIFKHRYKDYLGSIPFTPHQENEMYQLNFTQEMIRDILSTKEYSLSGIAFHTHVPEEVLSDVASGVNKNPTFELSRKLFELHMVLRRDLYAKIIEKILSRFLSKVPEEEDKD